MKIFVRIFMILLLCSAASVQAATCRSGDAAARGSQNGYERDKQVAEQIAQNERSSSDILGKCVRGITAVITAPQFPSLSDIFDQIKNKVCQIASDQIHGAVNDANGQINRTGVGQVIGNASQVSGPTVQQTHAGSSQSSTFWSNIWK